MPKIQKVTDPSKIVTDPQVLKMLANQGIDPNYVEFYQDYAPRFIDGVRVKGRSPYAKFYLDLKSGKRFMVVSNLPKVKPNGQKIEVGWLRNGNRFESKANLFSAVVEGKQITVTCLSDQPDSRKEGDQAIWQPQLFLDGVEQTCGKVILLETDPINENYHQNVLEYNYGFCKRRIRVIEGRFRDRVILTENPHGGEVRVYNNKTGNMRLRFGSRDGAGRPIGRVEGDVEIITKEELDNAVYPITIGASPETYYPDTNAAGVDGWTRRLIAGGATWENILLGDGNGADDAVAESGFLRVEAHTVQDVYNSNLRPIFVIDCSDFPPGETVTGVDFEWYGTIKNNDLGDLDACIYSAAPANPDALVAGDYNELGSTPYSNTISYAGYNASGYTTFAFIAAGIAAVQAACDGNTVVEFGTRSPTRDVTGTLPPWTNNETSYLWGYYTEQGAGFKPRIIIAFEIPAPPDAPTGLTATDNLTDRSTLTWNKPIGQPITGNKIYEGENLIDTIGDVEIYHDMDAPAPTITPGNAVATDGSILAHVALNLDGESTANGASRTYKVVAYNDEGDSDPSNTDTGHTVPGSLDYQWQRSDADADADYNTNIGTTEAYNDTGAPENGDGRYYRCVLDATGAAQQISTVDRGYRKLSAPISANMAARMIEGKMI